MHGLIKAVNGDNAEHWPKDLFLSQPHARRYISKHGWLNKPTMRILAISQMPATTQQPGTFVLAYLYIAQHALELLLIDQWPHLRRRIQAIANPQLSGACNNLLSQGFGNTTLDNQPAGRSTALARCAKGTPYHPFEDQIKIGIIQHNHGVFSTQLEADMLNLLCSTRSHRFPGGCRAGKRDHRNIGVLNKRLP